jgi:uncharacterized damage-inducible protein DinB
MKDVVRRFDAYTRWADRTMLEAVEKAPREAWAREIGGGWGSVLRTATHLVWAQAVWLERWEGRPSIPAWTAEEVPSPEALRERSASTSRARAAFLARQTDASLAAELPWTSLKGQAFADPLGDLVLQVLNHSTYHRGQVATLLRLAGAVPASTDWILWMRAGRPDC